MPEIFVNVIEHQKGSEMIVIVYYIIVYDNYAPEYINKIQDTKIQNDLLSLYVVHNMRLYDLTIFNEFCYINTQLPIIIDVNH